jgi:hypothetical protein
MLGKMRDGAPNGQAPLAADSHCGTFVPQALHRKQLPTYWASAPMSPWMLRPRRLTTASSMR